MKDPISMLLDENCSENIILYGETGEEIEFEQIAVINYNGQLYAVLHPLDKDIPEDEALVFAIDLGDSETELTLVDEDEVIDRVFDEYYRLLEEAVESNAD